uniref:FixH family protein n=1 Tax=Stappia sp. TaxID=1870903 RepID=UPI003BA99F35
MTAATDPMSQPPKGKPITGRTVLFWLIGFFTVVFVANAIFIQLALDSFPGVTSDSAYEDGLAYNSTLAAARDQAALGWEVAGEVSRVEGTPDAMISVNARDADNAPIAGLLVTAKLQRAASPEAPRTLVLQEGEVGRYTVDVAGLESGNWLLELVAARGEGDARQEFRSENRIFLR